MRWIRMHRDVLHDLVSCNTFQTWMNGGVTLFFCFEKILPRLDNNYDTIIARANKIIYDLFFEFFF